MTINGSTQVCIEGLVPVTLCTPQIPHGLLWDQSQAWWWETGDSNVAWRYFWLCTPTFSSV